MCILEEKVITKAGVAELGYRESLTCNCSFRVKVKNQAAHISPQSRVTVQNPGLSQERPEENVLEKFVHS